MTAATLAPSLLDAAQPGLSWLIYDETQPTSGRCPISWCDGECDKVEIKDRFGVTHFHDVAEATIDGAMVLQIDVSQWRPTQPYMDTADAWVRVFPKKPKIAIYAYRDGEPSRMLLLEQAHQAASLAEVLRAIGHNEFADVLASAFTLAERIEKEGKR